MLIDNDRCRLRLRTCDAGIGVCNFRCSRIAQTGIILPFGNGLLNGVLNVRLNCQINVVSAGAQFPFDFGTVCRRVRKVARFKHVRHNIINTVFNKICHVIELLLSAYFKDVDMFNKCGVVFGARYEALIIHCFKNNVRPVVGYIHFVASAAVKPFIGIRTGIGNVRLLNHARKHCAFANGQFIEFLAEIVFCGCFKAVVGVAEVNIVHIGFKYFVL